MEFEFRWAANEDHSSSRFPIVWLYRPDISNPKMFFNFFDDTGGCSYNVNIPGFIELRDKIFQSKDDESVVKHYCTESWCAEVKGDVTHISFAYDETYGENMDTDLFYKVLCEWIDFVQQGPGQEGEPPVRKFTV